MPDPKPNRPAVFIEKIFPVTLLNKQVYYEHGGNLFKGLHRWYSRKPLSFSRASVLGSLLPDSVTMEEFEYLLGLNRRVDGHADSTTKLYKTPPSPERIKQVHDLCEQTWGTRTPTVLDAFAGGGSIPFEAVRYGLNVLASDLNPVAVVTMKAAMEYPLKFGPDLQHDIDKWVKWVGDEAEKRLAEFFPSQEGETVQNYLWAHTVVCPSCESVVPLSPNWWLSKTSNYAGAGQVRKVTSDWYAVKPIPNLAEKRVDFELVKGRKGKGTTIQTDEGEFDPGDFNTISRGVGKCPNCENIIETNIIYEQGRSGKLGHEVYAVAYRRGQSNLEFRLPTGKDIEAVHKSKKYLEKVLQENRFIVPQVEIPYGHQFAERSSLIQQGIDRWDKAFNLRQLLSLVTYVEILNEAKKKLRAEYEPEKVGAICTYLSLVLARCIDVNCRLAHVNTMGPKIEGASGQHSLNLFWNYPETNGSTRLWQWCSEKVLSDYQPLCKQLGHDSPSLSNPNPLVAQSSRLQTQAEASISISKPEACATNLGKDDLVAQSSRLQIQEGDLGKGIKPEACATGFRKRKRKNLPHWEMDGAVYTLGFTTQDRIEFSPEARQVILDACKFFDGVRYQNYAIVVMPDHVHWLIQPLPKDDGSYWSLTSITHSIKSYTAHEVPKVMPHIGKLWQLESYDRIVRDEREFFDTWEYIRQNPVEAGLSESPEAYPFFWQMEEDQDTVAQPSRLQTPEAISMGTSKLEVAGLGSKPEACATIVMASADNLAHIADKSLDAIVTDPPYYATIQYSELSDFFYVWQKRVLGDIFPELYFSELTDKDREAVANPSRFRNMGESAEELANRDYEAKMALAFAEYFRVLRDDGVMTVQFNHKDSGAWDVLAKSLIDAGFEITASWAVSTENPQNLHQAQKNSVSSTNTFAKLGRVRQARSRMNAS
jgi:adenine-specific DNA methylase